MLFTLAARPAGAQTSGGASEPVVVTIHSNDLRTGLCVEAEENGLWLGRHQRLHEGTYTVSKTICPGSCGRPMTPGSYFICGDGITSSDPFTLPALGPIQLDVKAGMFGALYGGIVLTVLGASAVIASGVVLAMANTSPNDNPYFTVTNQSLVTLGGALVGVGVALAATGIGLFFVPRTTQVLLNGRPVSVNLPGTPLVLSTDGLHF